MNSTFKVVFNKARGALMVVNEVTSSVQAKGTKTVVATAVAAMIAGVAGTATADEAKTEEVTLPTAVWSGTTLPKLADKQISVQGKDLTGEYIYLTINNDATGTVKNAAIDLKTTGTESHVVRGIVNNGGNVSFGGDTFALTYLTELHGSGNNSGTAIKNNGGTLTFSAKTTSISAESTAKDGKAVYGLILAGASTTNLTGETVNIALKTATDRPADNYSEAIGIDIYGGASFNVSEKTVVNIKGESTGATETVRSTYTTIMTPRSRATAFTCRHGSSLTIRK